MKLQASASKALVTRLSERAISQFRPNPRSSMVCRRAQTSHQVMKTRRNFPIDKGLLAKSISFFQRERKVNAKGRTAGQRLTTIHGAMFLPLVDDSMLSGSTFASIRFRSQQPQHFRYAAEPDMVGFFIGELDIPVRVVCLLDAGINFGAIQQAAQFIELRHIDEFPLHKLLLMVVKAVLFLFPDEHGFFKGFLFIVGSDETKLFVELWGVLPFSADDPENDFTKIPVHSCWFAQSERELLTAPSEGWC